MTHTFVLDRARPWSDFNAYEGELHGRLDGHPVVGRTLVHDGDWSGLHPGDTLAVGVHFLRHGDVTPADTPAELTTVDGVNSVLVGTVRSRDGELLQVDSVLALEVDLDLTPHTRRAVADVQPGDRIRVEGVLEIDLEPED